MSIALGIDTGGTYTDAVLVEHETGRVLVGAKALTTKGDLSIGIREAVDRVLSTGAEDSGPEDVVLVSVSTTLATNAIVEGHGAPVCMLLVGYQGRVPDDVAWARQLGTPHIAHLGGGHTTDGQEFAPLDLAAARAAIDERAPSVASFGISGFFGTRNPAHELAVKALVRERSGLPVTCGHELTHRLDALRRATTVALNGRLIPLLCDLIDAVQATMLERGIVAPLMVVKGDGSLMSASMARERPIETILSGPAASVVGAQHLAGEGEALVADMGGTTTDIALISKGKPRLSPEGARVGPWRTMVEAIDVHTVGLGGDSRVWLDEGGDLRIGPRRVVPLCLLAQEYPDAVDVLARQLAHKPQPDDGEFLLLQRHLWTDDAESGPMEALLDALRQRPLAHGDLRSVVQHPGLYASRLSDLENHGAMVRAGLTPTDAAHVLGHVSLWDPEASRHGAALLARRMGTDPEDLCRAILRATSERVASELVSALMVNGHGPDRDGAGFLDSTLVAQALRPSGEAALDCQLQLRPILVGIGAPVETYFPRAAELLHGRLRIPEHAGVANAVGAVVGSVVQRVHALVVPDAESDRIRVHLPDEVSLHGNIEEAVRYAETRAAQLAEDGARRAGAVDVRVDIESDHRSAPVAEDWGDELFLETRVVASAAGRPRLAHEGEERWGS